MAMFLLGVVTSGGIASLPGYWDLPSIAITIGGSFASVLAGMSFKSFINGLKSFGMILRVPQDNTTEMIQNIINLSNVARKEGLLSLEEAAGDLDSRRYRPRTGACHYGDRACQHGFPSQGNHRLLGKRCGYGSCLGYDRYSGRSGKPS